MVYNNIVENYNSCLMKISKNNDFKEMLQSVVNIFEDNFNYYSTQSCPRSGSYNTDYANNVCVNFNDTRVKIENLLTTTFHQILEIGITLGELKNIQQDNEVMITSKSLESLINNTDNLVNMISDYFKVPNLVDKSQKYFNLYMSLKSYINELDNFTNICTLLNDINQYTSQHTDLMNKENYSTIKIQYYREDIELYEMSNIICATEGLYYKLCEIFEISLTQYKLQPIKIESGSLFEWLTGHKDILELFERILQLLAAPTSKFMNYIYKNYTDKGKNEKFHDIVKSDLDLIACAKEVGLEISDESKYIVDENIAQVLKHSQSLLSKGQVDVNGKNIVPETLNGQILLENNTKLIENNGNESSNDSLELDLSSSTC